jgi:quercetin dioxygenase-like cupin family protein
VSTDLTSGFEKLGDEIGAGISVIVVNAEPGEGPRLHRHPYPEVFVVLEGEATFTLDGEQRVVRAGEIVVAPGGVAHGFTNTGDGRLLQVDVHESPRFQTEWLEPRD